MKAHFCRPPGPLSPKQDPPPPFGSPGSGSDYDTGKCLGEGNHGFLCSRRRAEEGGVVTPG